MGTAVAREIEIILENLGNYAQLLQGIAEEQVCQIDRITLDTTKREQLKKQVIVAAVNDAKIITCDLAAELDLEIFGVWRVLHGNSGSSHESMGIGGAGGFEIPSLEIEEEVTVIFQVENTKK